MLSLYCMRWQEAWRLQQLCSICSNLMIFLSKAEILSACSSWKKTTFSDTKTPPLEKQIKFFDSMQLLSLYGRDRALTVWLSWGPECHRSPFTGAVCAWKPGLDLIGRRSWRGRQFVIIWVTTCLTDMLPHWPLFVLWTDNKTVCVRLCWGGGEKEKNDNDEGAGKSRVSGLNCKIPNFSRPSGRFALIRVLGWNKYLVQITYFLWVCVSSTVSKVCQGKFSLVNSK